MLFARGHGQTDVTVAAYKKYVRATGKPMPEEPVVADKKLNPNWSIETVPMTMGCWMDARAVGGGANP
ncbi:MAG TPA: hypothetical protein VGL53_11880 [Bryobacteraceae bacterium]